MCKTEKDEKDKRDEIAQIIQEYFDELTEDYWRNIFKKVKERETQTDVVD
jgi:crotonobetainyl-CoA:carnitine CoA-transferase CaiB-like acyl-CoA transferase